MHVWNSFTCVQSLACLKCYQQILYLYLNYIFNVHGMSLNAAKAAITILNLFFLT